MSIEKHKAFIDSLSPDLKEQVKELVRDAMDTQGNYSIGDHNSRETYLAFRELCAPEVKP